MYKRKRLDAPTSRKASFASRRWKSSRKTYYRNAGTMSLPRRFGGMGQGAPLASEMPATLIYSDHYTLNPGAGTYTGQIHRLNSLFDPDYTGVGHQPRGFDQLALLYSRYRVNAVKVEVVPEPLAGADTTPNAWWTYLVGEDIPAFTMSDYEFEENPERVCPVYMVGNFNNKNGTAISPKMVWYCKLKDIYRNKDIQDDYDTTALVSGNPSRTVYGSLVVGAKGGGDPPATYFQVTLTYYCTFLKPKYVSGS